jgi:hemoglobin
MAVAGCAVVVLAGCAFQGAPAPVAPLKDGELAIPANYRNWPKFLSAVQRPDAKQVREIYMNPAATAATAATGFPNGTVFVMENYAAAANPDGSLRQSADGKLVKGDLLRVFVMGKNAGWGQSAPEGLKNGDWIYAGWLPNGEKSPEATTTCRTCHLPLVGKDFVHRYDEFFAKTAAHGPRDAAPLARIATPPTFASLRAPG